MLSEEAFSFIEERTFETDMRMGRISDSEGERETGRE